MSEQEIDCVILFRKLQVLQQVWRDPPVEIHMLIWSYFEIPAYSVEEVRTPSKYLNITKEMETLFEKWNKIRTTIHGIFGKHPDFSGVKHAYLKEFDQRALNDNLETLAFDKWPDREQSKINTFHGFTFGPEEKEPEEPAIILPKSLKVLYCPYNPKVNITHLSNLEKLNMADISIGGYMMIPNGPVAPPYFPNLRELRWPFDLPDYNVIGQMKHLVHLDIYRINQPMPDLPNLKILVVRSNNRSTNIDDYSQLTGLKSLEIIGNPTWEADVSFPNLRRLVIEFGFGRDGLNSDNFKKSIIKMKNLQVLMLGNTNPGFWYEDKHDNEDYLSSDDDDPLELRYDENDFLNLSHLPLVRLQCGYSPFMKLPPSIIDLEFTFVPGSIQPWYLPKLKRVTLRGSMRSNFLDLSECNGIYNAEELILNIGVKNINYLSCFKNLRKIRFVWEVTDVGITPGDLKGLVEPSVMITYGTKTRPLHDW